MIKFQSDLESYGGKGHPEKLFNDPPRSKSPPAKQEPLPAYQLAYNNPQQPQTFGKPQASHTIESPGKPKGGIGITVAEKVPYQNSYQGGPLHKLKIGNPVPEGQ
jgi:hypothetical protein